MASPETSQLLQLYQKAAPASFFEQICIEQDYHFRQRVYIGGGGLAHDVLTLAA
jgi:hypothetical protein